jgi:hypothetical protein
MTLYGIGHGLMPMVGYSKAPGFIPAYCTVKIAVKFSFAFFSTSDFFSSKFFRADV